VLHGRISERQRLAALLERASHGRAAAIVIHGEAGVGKSALLDDLVAGAVDARVLRTQGLESESPLAFAALHRLLRPISAVFGRLAAPQARALRVAFGQEDGPAVDPFLVAVATLSALTEAAEDGPVLCVVDDAHWLDDASADALLFTARRLQADRVALVFAARDDDQRTFHHDGVAALRITGLDEPAARALLAERAGTPLAEDVSQQVLAQAAGNPLALVELPSGLTEAQRNGTAPIPSQLPVSADLQRVFLDRYRRLPHRAQTLLLVAAADDSGQFATVRQAAETLGAGLQAVQEAEQSGLLLTDGNRVRLRHPLVRSAIYQTATGLQRRHAHRALADALDPAEDADRQTWHRAEAAEGPDLGVVAALERAAAGAEQRGGYLAAAAGYERAAELSTGNRQRAEHSLAAARNAWAAGQTTRAGALATRARECADDPVLRADIDRLRGRIAFNVGSADEAHRILMRAARAVADDDPDRALEMAVVATVLTVYGGDSRTTLQRAVIDTHLAPQDPARTGCLKRLLVGMTAAGHGDWAAADQALRDAQQHGRHVEDPDVLANLGATALHHGDDDAARRCFTAMLSQGREQGAGMLVLYTLPRLTFTQLLAGEWTAAGSSAADALALARSVGQPALTATPLAQLALLAARQGTPGYDALLGQAEDVAASHQLGILAGPVHDVLRWAKGSRAVHDGDAGTALHHLGDMRIPAIRRMAALDRIDAAMRADDHRRAAAWVEELATFADATGWPWALATADHGRALLADAAHASVHFDSCLAYHAGSGRPYERARSHLAYGEFLRRAQHRVDARGHLRLALDTFQDLHAEPFVTRTTQELRASGETARKRDPSTVAALTPTEAQIAQLVRQGLSNKEIAAQCWISPRTVAFHLRNCFTKAGVTSRGELAQVAFT
jgi:DNA-binding CsgD family transcriptional regulator